MDLKAYALYVVGVTVLAWGGVFTLSCVLLAWANTPHVIHACGGFWEFMVAAVLSPVAVPTAFALFGVGVVPWYATALSAVSLRFGLQFLYGLQLLYCLQLRYSLSIFYLI